MSDATVTAEKTRSPWWVLALAVALWFGLWFFTPGLHSNGLGPRFTYNPGHAMLIESLIVAILAMILILTHRTYTRTLFAPTRSLWLYALPLALAVAQPFHYGQELPVWVYIVWMAASVFWQDYLTFGLLQSYLSERLSLGAVIAVSAVVFWLGHVIFLPHRFGPEHIVASLAILALGFVLAWIRVRSGTIHLLLALHLAFYFAFS